VPENEKRCMNWQSIIALAIVVLTAVIFIVSAAKKRRKPGCGGGCGCAK
jgi:hypothetical protein